MSNKSITNISTMGIDFGKNSFRVVGLDRRGAIVLRQKWSRRDFAAWLGLVPRQISTGDRTILGKISKRGNRNLRVLFVQAAWVVLIWPQSWERHGLKSCIEPYTAHVSKSSRAVHEQISKK
jgi:hypothetical protein